MISIDNNRVELAGRTTFGIPARCRTLIEYTDTRADLPALRAAGHLDPASRWKHIGCGANLLFTADYDGTIIVSADRTHAFSELPGGSVELQAAAGCVLDGLIAESADRGLWGLENLSGIPGAIGGTVVQNVGAYGAELADTVTEVTAYDVADGRFVTFTPGECEFGYRHSRFKAQAPERHLIIAGVRMRLSRDAAPRLGYGALSEAVGLLAHDGAVTPAIVRQAVLGTRAAKLPDPALVGSAGSFFKNPEIDARHYAELLTHYPGMPGYTLPSGLVKVPAAWLIDRAGWKGRRVGGAAVWARQPLVIVNLDGHATAADVLTLQEAIRLDIADRYGIQLTPEVEFC